MFIWLQRGIKKIPHKRQEVEQTAEEIAKGSHHRMW